MVYVLSMHLLILAMALPALLAAGCAGQALTWDHVELPQPILAPIDQKAQPVALEKVLLDLPYDEEYGAHYTGRLCRESHRVRWKGRREINLDLKDFQDAFRTVMEEHNYPVAGDPDLIFKDRRSRKKAVYSLGARITEARFDFCESEPAFTPSRKQTRGFAYLRMKWEIYSNISKQVEYRTETEGTWINEEFDETNFNGYWAFAFTQNIASLLEDPNYHELVMAEPKELFFTDDGAVVITGREVFDKPLPEHLEDVRLGAVTVYAGDSQGSGFIIDPKGYVLTNEHVAGGADYVTVELITGRKMLAEVVRDNPARDVALLKLEEKNLPVLPILPLALHVGETVYAIGAPIHEDYTGSISQGIVSAYRDFEGSKYIQSDVSVNPGNSGGPLVDARGNARGMTVSQQSIHPLIPGDIGVNFFIPIADALRHLNIECRECDKSLARAQEAKRQEENTAGQRQNLFPQQPAAAE